MKQKSDNYLVEFDAEKLRQEALQRKLRRDARSERLYKKDVRAIARVEVLQKPAKLDSANGQEQNEPRPRVYLKEPWPGLPVAVRRAIRAITGEEEKEFGLDAVLNYIAPRFPSVALKRVDVSRELWRLKEKGRIKVVVEGAGKRGAIYRIAESENGQLQIESNPIEGNTN